MFIKRDFKGSVKLEMIADKMIFEILRVTVQHFDKETLRERERREHMVEPFIWEDFSKNAEVSPCWTENVLISSSPVSWFLFKGMHINAVPCCFPESGKKLPLCTQHCQMDYFHYLLEHQVLVTVNSCLLDSVD